MVLDAVDALTPAVGWNTAFVRVGLALLLGGLLGLDRELLHKAAGVRTLALVCVGSATFMMLAEELAQLYDTTQTQYDPGRLAAGVIQGIGFLGAGSIIQSRGDVKGVTTAASVWAVAGIGLCIGAGAYGLAFIVFIATFLVLLVLRLLIKPLEATKGDSGD